MILLTGITTYEGFKDRLAEGHLPDGMAIPVIVPSNIAFCTRREGRLSGLLDRPFYCQTLMTVVMQPSACSSCNTGLAASSLSHLLPSQILHADGCPSSLHANHCQLAHVIAS